MNLPGCCADATKDYAAKGMKPGAAMMKAVADHKAGKHGKPTPADGDGDEYGA